MKGRTTYLIMHDIRSAHNVGSLFRTADGLGVSKIFLTGYTGAPIDRFGRKDTKISKVSLGAEDTIPWEKKNINETIQNLKKERCVIVALEQAPQSTALSELKTGASVALIVGNEVEGVPEEILKECDVVVEIPMHGEKESFNVSVAGAIALYAITNS